MKPRIFPNVNGNNLERKKLVFPDDFPAKFNVILMAFYQHQQQDINTWLPFVDQLENTFREFAYLELPVIYKMGPIRRVIINEGMRAGISDRKAREKTVTLYLDKPPFLGQLGIDSEDEIQILLVADDGQVLWHETGLFSTEKGTTLEQLLDDIHLKADDISVTS